MLFAAVLTLGTFSPATAQSKEKLIPYGDMNRWVIRNIHES